MVCLLPGGACQDRARDRSAAISFQGTANLARGRGGMLEGCGNTSPGAGKHSHAKKIPGAAASLCRPVLRAHWPILLQLSGSLFEILGIDAELLHIGSGTRVLHTPDDPLDFGCRVVDRTIA